MTAPTLVPAVVPATPPRSALTRLATVALGRLPDLDTRDAETIGYGLTGHATQTQRIDALLALAEYWAGQDHAAGLADIHRDTDAAIMLVAAGLTSPRFDVAVWDVLTDHAAELHYLMLHALAGTTPRYAQPDDGPPVTGLRAQRAMDREIADRREGMRTAAVQLVGVTGRRSEVAR